MRLVSRSVLAASAIVALAGALPASAATTLGLTAVQVADIGRDQVTVARHAVVPARIERAFVDVPAFDELAHLPRHAVVLFTIPATGGVKELSIYTSSGQHLFDQAALRGVADGKFRPEIIDGTAVGGTYLVNVDYTPDP